MLVEGRAVLVDGTAGRAVVLGPDGQDGGWSCTGLPPGSAARLLGSLTSNHVYAAVPDDGTFVISTLGRDDCRTAVSLAEPGTADFGPLAQDGRYVFVPDRTTGHTAVIDTVHGRSSPRTSRWPARATASSSPRRTASCSTTTWTPRSPAC